MTSTSHVSGPPIHVSQGRASAPATTIAPPTADQVAKARATKEAFSQFAGATFFGQLLKSMRQTVGKPAYFHGGQAEEIFRSQLDQVIADHMTEAGGKSLSEGMFRQQFPHLAEVLRRHEAAGGGAPSDFDQLAALRRL